MSATRPDILLVQSSARKSGSTTRSLAEELTARLTGGDASRVRVRDLSETLPFVDEGWIAANFTDPAERTEAQRAALSRSDSLVAELKEADILVIGAPIYNFGVPAALKAWIDMIARARETFRYTENGPVGLLEGKKAFVVLASGGTQVGSEIDFASGYLRHVLGFIGIHDVEIIEAGQQMIHGETPVEIARTRIAELAAVA